MVMPKNFIVFFSLLLFFQINLTAVFSAQEDVVGAKGPGPVAKIIVPYNNSLVRGDVPIWGLAYGKDFKEYVLEYGYGKNPRRWITIKRGNNEIKDISQLSSVNFEMVKTVKGNLGVWHTGLNEYRYANYTRGLKMGDYTLRLTVFTHHRKVSSKIMVSVGRVALNCMDNVIRSEDGEAELLIPALSLSRPVGLFFIDSLKRIPRWVRRNKEIKLLSKLYRIKPAGESFLQPITLKLYMNKGSLSHEENLAIWVFNPNSSKWEALDSFLIKEDNAVEARISSLMKDFAVYGIFKSMHRKQHKKKLYKEANKRFLYTPILCFNNFEQNIGEWRNKLIVPNIGLQIIKDKDSDNHYLKILNISDAISFSCVAYRKSFDVRTYKYLDFDYNISNDVKVDIFLRVGDKWLDVAFTDNRNTYWDVNIKQADYNIKTLKDGNWHHIRLNLYNLIKGKIDNFYYIDEIMFADLDAIGFKKLQFGRGHRGKYFLIDNFKISSDQYFWRIGGEYLNNTDHHIGNKYITKITTSDKNINIKFNVPEMFTKLAYHLQIKFRTPIDNKKRIEFFYNDSFREVDLSSSYCIDLILNGLKKGENSIIIKNIIGLLSKLEYVALYPIKIGTWEADSYYLKSRLHYKPYLFIDEIVLDEEEAKDIYSFPEDFDIFFYLQDTDSDFLLSILPACKNSSPLLYSLSNNISVFLNNILLQERVSGNQESNGSISFVIPKAYIKKGINRLRFKNLSHVPVLLDNIRLTKIN